MTIASMKLKTQANDGFRLTTLALEGYLAILKMRVASMSPFIAKLGLERSL